MSKRIMLITAILMLCMVPFAYAIYDENSTNDDGFMKLKMVDTEGQNVGVNSEEIMTITSLGIDEDTIQQSKSLFQWQDNLNVTGIQDGTTFLGGNNLTISSTINGILFGFAQTEKIGGTSEYAFLCAENINLASIIEKDAFIITSNFIMNDNSKVQRDLYIIGNHVKFNDAIIGRDLKVSATGVNIENMTIYGNLSISSSKIVFGENVVVVGMLKYNDNAQITGLEKVSAGEINTYPGTAYEPAEGSNTVVDIFFNFVYAVLSAFLIGAIINLLFPGVFRRLVERTSNYAVGGYAKSFLIGVLALIATPIVALILVCTVIGIPFAIFLMFAYIIAIAVTTIIVGYLLGKLALEKWFKQKDNVYVSLAIGIVLIELLKLIPFVDGLVNLLILFIGLGLIVKILKKEKKFDTNIDVQDTTKETIIE